MEYTLGYREVIPDQTLPDKWKEIVLTTGGTQSALQDIKVPERAGGYCYKDFTKYFTRNRFIYWRIIHDVLELVECSLDVNLLNNRVRYKFTDTPLLDGISIHETIDSVIILVVTVSSIHKLSFSHPDRIYKQEQITASHLDVNMQSIFNEVTSQNARDSHSFHMIPTAGSTNSPVPHAAASWLTVPQKEALFTVAYSSGLILLLRFDFTTGLIHSNELKQESIVPRFLSGIATALRGRSIDNDVTMSLVVHSYKNDIYLFALCREGNLRMWSCKKIQCITELNIAINRCSTTNIIQNQALKKMVVSDDDLYLCTYLKLDVGCEFCILKTHQDSGLLRLNRLCTLPSPMQHLVDFSFTSTRLWAVWKTADVDKIDVTHIKLSLHNIQSHHEWEFVVLTNSFDKEYMSNDPNIDPRQAYINQIFYPGRFSLMDINRALSIYRRSNFTVDSKLCLSLLKENVCMAVEAEIQAEVMDYELTDEDYLEIVTHCWSKFYSCVLQYHLYGSRPIGLLLLPSVYGAILLKKSFFSILRPMEALEHLMLRNETSCIEHFKMIPIVSQDYNGCQDLIILISALIILEDHLTDDIKSTFEKEIYQLKSPDIIVDKLLTKILFDKDELFSDLDFLTDVHHRLENIKDISNAIAMLLEILTYDLDQPCELDSNEEYADGYNLISNINYLFGSQIGMSTISVTSAQIAMLRFNICRNLLILQQFILSQPESFNSQSLHIIKSSLAPRTVVLTQSYYIILWICTSNVSIVSSQKLLHNSVQRLFLLKVDKIKSNIDQRQQQSVSLLEQFIQYGAKEHLHKSVKNTNLDVFSFIIWHHGMLSYVTLIAQLVWPISGNFIFPEWLLSSCQFPLVQDYVRLLSTWCEWNSASRKFILAISYLEMGDPHKACDYFLRASNGIITDSYMSNLLLCSETVSESHALVRYYLKVIEIFEQHNISDCIIELAMTAIAVGTEDDPNLATLHSIVFVQHLHLQHHIEAYNFLNTNPDAARRIDCLRQLVVTLFKRKKLINLILFPYVDMYQDLEKIMEARARSVDLMENNYYDFLYSFHINKGNVRKAAFIMYEQAIRLNQEPQSFTIISRHGHCLLACINALNLVHEKYRWIVRPVIEQNINVYEYDFRKKRTIYGNEIIQHNIKKQIEVLELDDIRREYILSEAKLKLLKFSPNIHLSLQSGPLEIVSLMSNHGLFIDSLYVCENFQLSKCSVLENLASQCVSLNQKGNSEIWDWLNHNNILDLSITTSNVANIVWKLLQKLTLAHERDTETKLHRGVARTFFHHNKFLPEWLLSSYKERDPNELLRLMIQMGRLEEAGYFSLAYIEAVLGRGKEYFGLETSLLSTLPSVHIPFNILEILLLELKCTIESDHVYSKVYELLENALRKYLKIVERVSVDMIQLKKLNT